MTREELKEYLIKENYKYERDSEYNRDVLTKDGFMVDEQSTKLEVFIDRYSVKITWWYEQGKKVSTSAYISKLDLGIFKLMVKGLIDNNKKIT